MGRPRAGKQGFDGVLITCAARLPAKMPGLAKAAALENQACRSKLNGHNRQSCCFLSRYSSCPDFYLMGGGSRSRNMLMMMMMMARMTVRMMRMMMMMMTMMMMIMVQ